MASAGMTTSGTWRASSISATSGLGQAETDAVVTLAEVVVAGLAGWRIAALISQERGPFAILVRLRSAAGIEHLDDTPTDHGGGEFGRLMYCTLCLSPWLALAMYALFRWGGGVGEAVVAVLAIAAVIALADRWRWS